LEAATPLVLGSQAEFFQALDADLLFIFCTTISVWNLVAGHVHVANASGGGVASAVFAASISCWSRAIFTRFPTSWSCTTQSNQQKTWREGASASVVSAARQIMAHVVALNRIHSLRQCSTLDRA
jgi:hypothetical protein